MQKNAIIGLDFPFSLHHSQLGHSSWVAFVLTFAARFATSDEFYQRLGGKGQELRRHTDVVTKTPMAPTNLRLYRQTYFGIRDLLAPLVLQQQAKVFPIQERQPSLPTLIEICPAVTLMKLGLRLKHYKGNAQESEQQRRVILIGLQSLGVKMSSKHQETVLQNSRGDALDSIIAALSTAQAFHSGALERSFSPIEVLEGFVFA